MAVPDPEPASLELHPARQAMLDQLDQPDTTSAMQPRPNPARRRQQPRLTGANADKDPSDNADVPTNNRLRTRRSRRAPKTFPYIKEMEIAKQREIEQIARQKAREERARDRRAMAKAKRPDREGRIRLGRQSKVLLSRAQRAVAQDRA